jgi:hypothetical protein
MMLQLQPLL